MTFLMFLIGLAAGTSLPYVSQQARRYLARDQRAGRGRHAMRPIQPVEPVEQATE